MTAINTRAGRPYRRRPLTRRLLSVAVLVALIVEACVTGLATAGPARADDLGCKYTPAGLIAKHWAELRGRDVLYGNGGELGCATGPEAPVPGTNGFQMPFERGAIVRSPDQGPNMTVAAYQVSDDLVVRWGDTGPFSYDKFIVRWSRDGGAASQADVSQYISRTDGFFTLRAPDPGTYAFSVEGCDTGALSGSTCRQGFTAPVTVTYQRPAIPVYRNCPAGFRPVVTAIMDRWAVLGGGEGPLGCPTGPEQPTDSNGGLRQSFQHGQIVASPGQGPDMLVAVYQDGGQLVADWGDTSPFHYDRFNVRWDRDGSNVGQVTQDGERGGHWSTPVGTPGTYTVAVEGCDTHTLGSSTCRQGFTIPASVNVTFAPAPVPQNCPALPVGPLLTRWLALGGSGGQLGCPAGPQATLPGGKGISQPFQHGSMVTAPQQGPNMVVAVYQSGPGIAVNWGATAPFSYDFFNLRLERDGAHIGQVQVKQAGTGGSYTFSNSRPEDDKETPVVDGAGGYSVTVEGCDSHTLGQSTCRQGFTPAASVDYLPFGDIDLSAQPTPATVSQALAQRPVLSLIAAERVACDKPLSWPPANKDDFALTAIAKMYVASVINNHDGPPPRCPGHRLSLREEVNDAIRPATIDSQAGTDGACGRTGDYDVLLKGYIRLYDGFGDYLDPDVRYRIVQLLDKRGSFDETDEHVCTGKVPESENHLWMIETSRYLTNQIQDPTTGRTISDNARNGMDAYMLTSLQNVLKGDFIEYNSRPYERYTVDAIENLYDYAQNTNVKTAARMVLDYLAAKVAASASDGRRDPPYRRRESHNHLDLFHSEADPLAARFFIYTAPTPAMRDMYPAKSVTIAAAQEMVLEATSTYRPPDRILDLWVNPADRSFFQRFHYDGAEVDSAEPGFLITGGGLPTGPAYTVLGQGADEDRGVVEPVMLMPAGGLTSVSQMIHAGYANPQDDQLCIGPDFACGSEVTIPTWYTSGARAKCVLRQGDWTFLDVSSSGCAGPGPGFDVAVYGAAREFGFFEAVPAGKLNGASLADFARQTLARNQGRTFALANRNSYVAWDGNTIVFDARDRQPILKTGIPAIDSLPVPVESWPLAAGTLINSAGRSGRIVITTPGTAGRLILDDTHATDPVRSEPAI